MNNILKLLILSLFLFSTNSLNASTQLNFSKNNSFDEQTLKRVNSWKKMKKLAEDKNILNKLKLVNNYFNKLSFRSDIDNWKTEDYWATPFEFLTSGFGDCEDYAIAKYYTLRQLGINKEKLKLTYARLTKNNQAHMVLSYYHKTNFVPIILDNINKKLQLSTKRKDLKKIRVFENENILNRFKLQIRNKIKINEILKY